MINIPNQLTISRFWMTIIMMVCMSMDFPHAKLTALLVFILASATDALDGHLARNHFGCTTFGKLMDPLADKVLVCAAFIGFVEHGMISAWMVALIISREFMVTGLRLLVIEKGVVMSAGMWGKVKTTVQMLAICLFFAGLIWPTCCYLPATGSRYALIVGLVTALITAWSGVIYFWQQRALLVESD